jgi:hypothetical protein
MKQPIIKKNDERKHVNLEPKTLIICPNCSRDCGTFRVVDECDCGCGEYLDDGEAVCSEGRHYLKSCFEQMEKDGLVEKENHQEELCVNCGHELTEEGKHFLRMHGEETCRVRNDNGVPCDCKKPKVKR